MFRYAFTQQPDLPFIERRNAQITSGNVMEYDVTGPVKVHFANRTAICNAFVSGGDTEPLLSTIPIEEMPARLPYFKILCQGGCIDSSTKAGTDCKP